MYMGKTRVWSVAVAIPIGRRVAILLAYMMRAFFSQVPYSILVSSTVLTHAHLSRSRNRSVSMVNK